MNGMHVLLAFLLALGTVSCQVTGNIPGLPTGSYSVDDYLNLAVCNQWIRNAIGASDWENAAGIFLNGVEGTEECAGGKSARLYVQKDSFLELNGPTTYEAFYMHNGNDTYFLDTLSKKYLCSSSFGSTRRLRHLLEDGDNQGTITRDTYCNGVSKPNLEDAQIAQGLIKVPQILVGLVIGLSESEKSILQLGSVSKESTAYVFSEGYAFTVGKDSGKNDTSLFYTVYRREQDFGVSGKNQVPIKDAYEEGLAAINNANSMTGTSGELLRIQLSQLTQTVTAHYLIALAQSMERYADLLDKRANPNAVPKQREELALFHYAVGPFVTALNKAIGEELDSMVSNYQTSSSTDDRCRMQNIFQYFVQSLYAYGVSWDNYGSLQGASSCSENATLLQIPHAVSLPLGSKYYTPYLPLGIRRLPTEVKDYAMLSYDVCDIIGYVIDKDWNDAIEVYLKGRNAPGKSLYSYAVKNIPDSATYRRFKNYYGSETFIDDYIKEYFCSRSVRIRKLLEDDEFSDSVDLSEYCSGYSGNPSGYQHVTKIQSIGKTVQNWIGIFMSTVEFEKAVSQAGNGQNVYGSNPSASHSLGEAYLFYTGARPGDECSAFATTDRRFANFGAKNQDGILAAFKDADAELQQSNPSSSRLRSNFDKATALHLAVYAMGVTRYGYFLDRAGKEGVPAYKYKAEGKTFFRIIAPYVASVDKEGAENVEQIFADENAMVKDNQNYYCQVEKVMNCFVRSMDEYGVSVSENYGRLEQAERDDLTCDFTCHNNKLDLTNGAMVRIASFILVVSALVASMVL